MVVGTKRDNYVIKVKKIFKSFENIKVLTGTSFYVKKGEIFGLLGINGAGKTTLIRIIAGILKADAGSVIVAGFEPKSQQSEVRKQLGVLTTDIGIYDRLTAYENVCYFADLAGIKSADSSKTISKLFKFFDIHNFSNRLVSKLSTGMRQKVAIVRTVVHHPSIIIFDEPTLGLDVVASQSVLNFIKHKYQNDQTIILSTHNMHLAESVCDRVGLLHNGRIITLDSPRSIIKKTKTKNLEKAFLKLVQGEKYV